MLLHNSVRNCEPKTGAAAHSFGGEEWIIDFGHVLWRDAYAVVGDFDHNQAIVTLAGLERNEAVAIRNGVTRVQNQVGKHLLEFYRVSVDLRQFVAVLADDLNLAAA